MFKTDNTEKEQQDRFVEAVLSFIERETKEPSPEYARILPGLAKALVDFWIYC